MTARERLQLTELLTHREEHQDLRTYTAKFLAASSPMADVRRLMEDGGRHDPAVWDRLGRELGLLGLLIPGDLGGSDAGPVESAIVLEEMGRALLCSPYLPSAVLATQALLLAGDDEAARRWLPGMAAGTRIATVTFEGPDSGATDSRARHAPDGWEIDATHELVLSGAQADLILTIADTDEGPALFAVRPEAQGVTISPVPVLDLTRPAASIAFSGTPAYIIGSPGGVTRWLDQWRDAAAIALAAEQLGVATAALDMAVSYAKLRIQFGQPIGKFQAIKHLLADMATSVEAARAAVLFASQALAEDSPDVPLAASLALSWTSDTAAACASENIQVHGGMGFTWEADPHLFFKRAHANRLLMGSPSDHLRQLADRLGI